MVLRGPIVTLFPILWAFCVLLVGCAGSGDTAGITLIFADWNAKGILMYGPSTIYPNLMAAYTPYLIDASGNADTESVDFPMITIGFGSGRFCNLSATCGNSSVDAVTIPAGQSYAKIYFKHPGPAGTVGALDFQEIQGKFGSTPAPITLGTRGLPGTLDTGFNSTGAVFTDFQTKDDLGESLAVQLNQYLVVAGSSSNGVRTQFGLARYNTTGILDSRFGSSGLVTTSIGLNTNDDAKGVAIQGDGKIVAAGITNNGGTSKFAVVRYSAAGTLDTTFGNSGIATTLVGTQSYARAIAIQSDSKILVAGSSQGIGKLSFEIIRYNTDGSLDSSFNSSGELTFDFGGTHNEAYSIAIQSDSKIVVAGYTDANGSNDDFAVARLNSDGSLDSTFGTCGKKKIAFFNGVQDLNDLATSVVLQPDGKILIGGTTQSASQDFAIARFNADGSLDTSFHSTGLVTLDFSGNLDSLLTLTLQPDLTLLAAGSTFDGVQKQTALARFTSSGSVDTVFNSNGQLTFPGLGNNEARSMLIEPDGKIVLAGFAFNGTDDDFAVLRIWP